MMRYPKPEKDPRSLPWHFPSMTAKRYKTLADEFYRQTCLHVLSQLSEFAGCLVVPCEVIHWRRKKSLSDRYVELFGRGYYMLWPRELTEKERQKYELMAVEVEGLAASGE